MHAEGTAKKHGRFAGMIKQNNTLLLLILIVIAVLGAAAVPAFRSHDNLLNILRNGPIVGIVALGATFVLLTGEIDLSVGSIMSLSAVMGGLALGAGDGVALAVTLATGFLLGLINGFIVAHAKITSFMVTLGMMSIYSGLANLIARGQAIYLYDAALYQWLCKGTVLGVPFPLVLMAVLTLVLAVMLRYSKYGHNVYYMGANEKAATFSGINSNRLKTLMYALSGMLAALAGPILCSQTNRITASIGSEYAMSAISVAVLGGTLLSGGKGGVTGTFLATAIFAVLLNLLALSGMGTYLELVLRGIILIGIVAVFQRLGSERTADD